MARRHKRVKRLIGRILLGVVVLAVLGAVVTVILSHPGGGRPLKRGAPVAALYYSCGLGGKLAPCGCEEGQLGGIARMHGLVSQWREDRADAFIVDVGNATVGGHPKAEAINRLSLDALDLLGCAVVNCGDNEVVLPRDQLGALGEGRKLRMISASITDAASGETVFPAYHIEARGGVQVAFIGLVRNDMDPTRIGKGLRLLEPEDALFAALNAIGDKADLIVVLAYLPPDQIYDLARKYAKVNIFLGGQAGATSASHELVRHVVVKRAASAKPGEQAAKRTITYSIVAYLGDQGLSVGRLDAAFPKGKMPVVDAMVRVLDDTTPESDKGKELAERFLDTAAPSPPGSTLDPKMPCTSSFVAAEVCKLCHINAFYSWQDTDHAGAYVTLLQRHEHTNPTCLACHVTGYTMPGGYTARLAELERAQAATKKRELEQALKRLVGDDDAARRREIQKQLESLKDVALHPFDALDDEALAKRVGALQRAVDALKNVGCENCHGGGRRHVGVALKDRSAIDRTPYQRADASARNCIRCHNPERPCVPEGEADAFDAAEYLKSIQHWR